MTMSFVAAMSPSLCSDLKSLPVPPNGQGISCGAVGRAGKGEVRKDSASRRSLSEDGRAVSFIPLLGAGSTALAEGCAKDQRGHASPPP